MKHSSQLSMKEREMRIKRGKTAPARAKISYLSEGAKRHRPIHRHELANHLLNILAIAPVCI